jgi:hypothetical protein
MRACTVEVRCFAAAVETLQQRGFKSGVHWHFNNQPSNDSQSERFVTQRRFRYPDDKRQRFTSPDYSLKVQTRVDFA